MKTRNVIVTVLGLVAVAAIVGYSFAARSVGQTADGSTVGGAPTRAATVISTSLPVSAADTATSVAGRTSPPIQDVISMLVTQAYFQVTPIPQVTQSPLSTAATAATVPENIARLLTPTATLDPAPDSVIFSEPILIANAVNTADCKIRNVGNCTPAMQAGVTLFFTWTFGVQGAEAFNWGQAAVAITRDGQPLSWTLVGNGLVLSPDSAKNQSWTLQVGQAAQFRAGLENAQRGYYTARFLMCMLSPNECSAGQGWQNVGGEAINFVIGP